MGYNQPKMSHMLHETVGGLAKAELMSLNIQISFACGLQHSEPLETWLGFCRTGQLLEAIIDALGKSYSRTSSIYNGRGTEDPWSIFTENPALKILIG
jgi:hypothetical protein